MKLLTSLVLLGAPSIAFAHGSVIDRTSDAIAAAADKFATEETNPLDTFTGIGGSPVDSAGESIKVVVTLKGNGGIAYSCAEQQVDGRDVWMCDKTKEIR